MTILDGTKSSDVGGPTLDVPAAPVFAGAPLGLGKPLVLVTFNAEKDGQNEIESPRMLTASVAAWNPLGNNIGGPIVGIVEWGSGNSAQFAVEFDVPVAAANSSAALDQLFGGSGVLISVPADYIRISARNDANLNSFPASPSELPPGDPSLVVKATAGVAVGTRPTATEVLLTRYGRIDNGANPIAPGGGIVMRPPPFSRSFRVFRNCSAPLPAVAPALAISMAGSVGLDGPITVAAGAQCPEITLPAGTTNVNVVSQGPANATTMGIIWTIGL